jgi:hypothetical protein
VALGGTPGGGGLLVGEHFARGDLALTEAGLHEGAVLRPAAGPGAGAAPAPVGLELRVVSGPDAGVAVPLSAGEVVVGRDPTAGVVLGVGTVSRRHCRVSVTRRGSAWPTSAPARRPWSTAAPPTRHARSPPGASSRWAAPSKAHFMEGFKYSDVFKAPEFWNESGFGKKVGGLVTELGGHSDVVAKDARGSRPPGSPPWPPSTSPVHDQGGELGLHAGHGDGGGGAGDRRAGAVAIPTTGAEVSLAGLGTLLLIIGAGILGLSSRRRATAAR